MMAVAMFSFKPFKDDEPKVVIVDIVNNLETANDQNVVDKFLKQIEGIDAQNVKVLMWKDLTADKTKDATAILSEVNPDYVLTVSFKTSEGPKENVMAVVSKNNKAKDQSVLLANDIAKALESDNVENKGIFETESKYAQDNEVPAVFVSVEVKNQPAVDDELASKLVNVIENVDVKEETPTEEVIEEQAVEEPAAQDSAVSVQ